MTTTSLELSKELYAVSGWKTDTMGLHQDAPLYELDYLLINKLPKTINGYWLILEVLKDGKWQAYYLTNDYTTERPVILAQATSDMPQEAVGLLCIELFKSGILTREKE